MHFGLRKTFVLLGLAFSGVVLADSGIDQSLGHQVFHGSDCSLVELLPSGTIPPPLAVGKDAYCSKSLLTKYAPLGAITVFGSARALPDSLSYEIVRRFAKAWTKAYGDKLPILTGGGLGIMEAANRGAYEAKGVSLAIGTLFPGKVGALEKPNQFATHTYMAASFAQREADLIDYAGAIVFAPGGFGTAWELFETLSKMQTGKKNRVPMILLGTRADWESFLNYVDHLVKIKTINPDDGRFFVIVGDPDQAVKLLAESLHLKKI